jgi:putative membrane protein
VIVVGSVLAGLAALLHVYIFILESIRWTAPRTRAVFRMSEQDAKTTQALAFNQGFYNLFLAIATVVGVVLLATGSRSPGAALVFAGTGSMVAAAVVLVAHSPRMARAALTQGTVPLLAVVATAIGLAAG